MLGGRPAPPALHECKLRQSVGRLDCDHPENRAEQEEQYDATDHDPTWPHGKNYSRRRVILTEQAIRLVRITYRARQREELRVIGDLSHRDQLSCPEIWSDIGICQNRIGLLVRRRKGMIRNRWCHQPCGDVTAL